MRTSGSVVDELLTQRDAVLFGTWVASKPSGPEEACLVERAVYKRPLAKRPMRWGIRRLSYPAIRFISLALHPHRDARWPWTWNDRKCRTQEEVLAVLDDAIGLAKEAADSEVTMDEGQR